MNLRHIPIFIFTVLLFASCSEKINPHKSSNYQNVKIRIAEIEIDSIYFNEYIAILKEEAASSVKLEKGVLCIYPMYQKENPTQIRLLEIYENEAAYQAHLKTEHFLHYKTTTLKMVKSLALIDMAAIDLENMPLIFTKLKHGAAGH
jgi:quinol monooxygenase YgiN